MERRVNGPSSVAGENSSIVRSDVNEIWRWKLTCADPGTGPMCSGYVAARNSGPLPRRRSAVNSAVAGVVSLLVDFVPEYTKETSGNRK